MSNKLNDMQQLIALSGAMLDHAREQLWDEVFELEERRRVLMQMFFLEPIAAENAEAVSAGIRLMMAIDCDIVALGTATRDELAHALQKMDQGKKAVKAYTG